MYTNIYQTIYSSTYVQTHMRTHTHMHPHTSNSTSNTEVSLYSVCPKSSRGMLQPPEFSSASQLTPVESQYTYVKALCNLRWTATRRSYWPRLPADPVTSSSSIRGLHSRLSALLGSISPFLAEPHFLPWSSMPPCAAWNHHGLVRMSFQLHASYL